MNSISLKKDASKVNLAAYRTMAIEYPEAWKIHSRAVLELCDEISRLREALRFLAGEE